MVGNNPVIFSGGSDRFIQLWNLNNVSNCACVVRPDGIANKMILKYRYIITLDNFEIAQISFILKSSFTKSFIRNMYRCYNCMLNESSLRLLVLKLLKVWKY